MPGTLTVSGQAAGLASGSNSIGPVTTTGLSVVASRIGVELVSGDNAFTVPTETSATISAVLICTGTTTATIKVRTNLNESDGGLRIAPAQGAGLPWTKFDLPTGTTKVILNSSGSVAGVELVFV